MPKCPHCEAEIREGAKICRSCGNIAEGGGRTVTASPIRAPSSENPETATATPSASVGRSGVRLCEICDKPPAMVKQIEKSSPVLPGVLAFVAFLFTVMALSWHSWTPKILLLAIGIGCGYAGYRIYRMERRYWLCPKCGDTINIEV